MTHEIETMAYAADTPWHGLGKKLSEKQPIEVWAQQAGMNWEILRSPAQFVVGQRDHEIGELKNVAERNVLYRSDTKAALSIVSDRYNIVQPREILEFYRDLTEVSGFELETAGVLKEGKKLWALARTGQSATFKGKDITNGYLLLATACDGSMATTAQFTSIRVVCINTLAIALNGSSAGVIKVPHSTAFDPQAVKQQLGISVTAWDDFIYNLKTLSYRKVKHTEAKRFIADVFNDPRKESPPNANDRSIATVTQLFEGKGRGSELESAKGTAFGLLNSVTEFIDHERRARSINHRLDSAWFGQGATLKQRALEQGLALIA